MSSQLLSLAVALFAAASALPLARAEGEICNKNAVGVEVCQPNVSSKVHIIVGLVVLGVLILLIVLAYFISKRRARKADVEVAQMSYNSNLDAGAAPPATYNYPFTGQGSTDPNLPPAPLYSAYPGPQGPSMGSYPQYAPPQGPPPAKMDM